MPLRLIGTTLYLSFALHLNAIYFICIAVMDLVQSSAARWDVRTRKKSQIGLQGPRASRKASSSAKPTLISMPQEILVLIVGELSRKDMMKLRKVVGLYHILSKEEGLTG